jgi:1-aminocyclopropane-1-carboxylate deaminase/D-cysteine desulfhydrase-like pyridoxal-dependent ACC family enzyme
MDQPLLFQKYPQLAKNLSWENLGDFPTAVQKMEKLGEIINCNDLWVKRDDLSSPKMGGNKVRIMEFLLAQMKATGKKVAISPGALGSNQILASAIYGNQLGLKIVGIFFKQCQTDYMCKHMLIDQSMGVEFVHVKNPYFVPLVILWQWLRNFNFRKFEGPFYIPTFGSSAVCSLGYFNAMLELKQQIDAGEMPEPDYIFVTVGTGGTVAGIEIGARVLGLKSQVVGVRITDYIACNERLVASIVNRGVKLLRKAGADIPPLKIKGSQINMIHDFFGGEYARITEEALAARKQLKEAEDITLDTTYTAKTMAAMIDFIRNKEVTGKTILFWHTYNTRDLEPFIADTADPKQLPAPFHTYFDSKQLPIAPGK